MSTTPADPATPATPATGEGLLEQLTVPKHGSSFTPFSTPRIPPADVLRVAVVSAVVQWDAKGDARELGVEWLRLEDQPPYTSHVLPELGRLESAIRGGLTIVVATSPLPAGVSCPGFALLFRGPIKRTFHVARLRWRVDVAQGADVGGLEQLVRGFAAVAGRTADPPPVGPA